MKKSTTYSSLPAYLSMSERFALAREAGLDGLQIPSFESQAEAEAAGQAAADNGLEISSVMGGTHWKLPLSSTDEEVREAGVEGILNFSPAKLSVPEPVYIRNVNLAIALESLSYSLTKHKKLKLF